MSETSAGQNKMVMYLLVAVVVLLAAVIGLLVWQKTAAEPTAQNPVDPAAAQAAANSPQPTQSGPFDPKTATKVPAGKTPEDFLKTYYEAVKSGDYKTAYECLPADKKAAQNLESFGQQLQGYGITGYSMDKPTTEGDQTSIVAYQETGFGNFGTVWTFVKDGENWLVKGKEMGGMQQ